MDDAEQPNIREKSVGNLMSGDLLKLGYLWHNVFI